MTGLGKSDIGGFAMVPHWLLDAIQNPVTLRVWCVLARHANTEGAAYPSVERMTTMAGVSASTLRRCLNELQVIGALEIRRRYDESGRQQSNMFFLRFAHPTSRQELLTAVDVAEIQPGRVPPMEAHPPTGGGEEGATSGAHNKTHSEQDTTEGQTTQLLRAAARGDSELFQPEPGTWWHFHDDRLVRAFMQGVADVPKFAALQPPAAASVERLAASLRGVAPDEQAVLYELETWVVWNTNQPKKGGTKDPVAAFRNWCAKKQGSWALERQRRQQRKRGKPGTQDPAAAHQRLMDHGVEEPF